MTDHPVSQAQAGHDAGLSDRQIKTAVRFANIPEADFTALVEGETLPTLRELARRGTQARPVEKPENHEEWIDWIGTD